MESGLPVVKATKRTKSVKTGSPKDPTPPKESNWPPFEKPPYSGTNSIGINELQNPIASSKPNKPTPLKPSYPPDPKQKKPTKASVLGSGIEAGLHTPAS